MSARVGAVAVAGFYALIFALAPADRPTVMADNAGYLAVGRWLADVGVTPDMTSAPFYAWGYGALFAPPCLFTTDIGVIYGYGVALNCVFGAALFVVLRRIVATAVPTADAGMCAAAGACWSGVALQSGQIWPESALALGVALWVLTLQHAAAGRRRAPVAIGALAAALFALHHRTAGIAVVTAVLLTWWLWRRRPGALAGLALLVAGVTATLLVDAAVRDALYPNGAVSFASSGALDAPGTLARILAGELWITVAGSAGLVALGVAGLLERRREPFALAVLAAVALTALISAGHLTAAVAAGHPLRSDYLAYGRYLAPAAAPLVALGVARLGARRSAIAVAAVAAVSVLMLALHGIAINGFPTPVNVTGVLGMGAYGSSLEILAPSVLGLGAGAVLVTFGGRRGAGLAAALAALAAVSAARELRPWHDRFDGRARAAIVAIDRLPAGERVLVEPPDRIGLFVLLQMMRPDRHFAYARVGADGWVAAPSAWRRARVLGARRVTDEFQAEGLWCVGRACRWR